MGIIYIQFLLYTVYVYFIATNRGYMQGMPKTGVLYSHKPWLYRVCRKQAYFIATNRGYRVCRKQAYFIATNRGYIGYAENRRTL